MGFFLTPGFAGACGFRIRPRFVIRPQRGRGPCAESGLWAQALESGLESGLDSAACSNSPSATDGRPRFFTACARASWIRTPSDLSDATSRTCRLRRRILLLRHLRKHRLRPTDRVPGLGTGGGGAGAVGQRHWLKARLFPCIGARVVPGTVLACSGCSGLGDDRLELSKGSDCRGACVACLPSRQTVSCGSAAALRLAGLGVRLAAAASLAGPPWAAFPEMIPPLAGSYPACGTPRTSDADFLYRSRPRADRAPLRRDDLGRGCRSVCAWDVAVAGAPRMPAGVRARSSRSPHHIVDHARPLPGDHLRRRPQRKASDMAGDGEIGASGRDDTISDPGLVARRMHPRAPAFATHRRRSPIRPREFGHSNRQTAGRRSLMQQGIEGLAGRVEFPAPRSRRSHQRITPFRRPDRQHARRFRHASSRSRVPIPLPADAY